jgi:GNAT superfamily N-acetyltransferase
MGSQPLSVVNVSRCVGDGWCAFVRAAMRGEALLLPGGSLGLTGEDSPHLNAAVVHGPSGVEEAVHRFAMRLHELGLPGTVVASSTVAVEAEAAAVESRLRRGPAILLMCLRAGDARRAEVDYPVERVTDLAGVRDAAIVLASTCDVTPELCERMLGPGFAALPASQIFLAKHEGRAIAVAGTSRVGPIVGFQAVATRPAHRRRGAGAAAVTAAIDHHLRDGARLFALFTEPGLEPFYASLGFVPADRMHSWVTARP